jgi:hypothetical protein
MVKSILDRLETLEQIHDDRSAALPLLDYISGEGELAYLIEGELIERLPLETADEYQQRAMDICQHTHRGPTMPLLQVRGQL